MTNLSKRRKHSQTREHNDSHAFRKGKWYTFLKTIACWCCFLKSMTDQIATIEEQYGEDRLRVMEESLRSTVTEVDAMFSPSLCLQELDIIEHSSGAEESEFHRLFGISAFRTKQKDLVCLRFDSCYQGRYYDMFYIFLDLHGQDGARPSIVAHTLPNFMPVDEWEANYLSIDVQSFSQCVSLHLNSYVARREQVRAVDSEFSENLEITSSDSFCHINIEFDDCIVKLLYHPDQRYPYSVEHVISSSGPRMLQRKRKQVGFNEQLLQLFKTTSLLSAIQSAFSQ